MSNRHQALNFIGNSSIKYSKNKKQKTKKTKKQCLWFIIQFIFFGGVEL